MYFTFKWFPDSNNWRERERERARRESRESELDRTRLHHRPNPRLHQSCRTPTPSRSRHRDRTPDRIAKIAPPPSPSRSNFRRLNLGAPHSDAGPRSPLTPAKPHLTSTIPDPHLFKPISFFFSSLMRTPVWDHADITLPRSSPMTHPWPISLFLDLPVPFPQFLITFSSSLSQFDRIVWV